MGRRSNRHRNREIFWTADGVEYEYEAEEYEDLACAVDGCPRKAVKSAACRVCRKGAVCLKHSLPSNNEICWVCAEHKSVKISSFDLLENKVTFLFTYIAMVFAIIACGTTIVEAIGTALIILTLFVGAVVIDSPKGGEMPPESDGSNICEQQESAGVRSIEGLPVGLVTVKKSEIPQFLHNSIFYNSLTNDDSDDISDGAFEEDTKENLEEDSPDSLVGMAHPLRNGQLQEDVELEEEGSMMIPAQYLKLDLQITSAIEVKHLLSTLHYWGSGMLPDELVVYSLNHPVECHSLLAEYSHDLEQLQALEKVVSYSSEHPSKRILLHMMLVAIEYSTSNESLFIMKCLLRCGKEMLSSRRAPQPYVGPIWAAEVLVLAAKRGDIACFQFAQKSGCPWDETVCIAALKHRQEQCLLYAVENGCPFPEGSSDYGAGYSQLFTTALASAGYKDLFICAIKHKCRWDLRTCSSAAQYGHIDILRYAHEHSIKWDASTSSYAATGGHLDCLKYAHENGCPWNLDACYGAAYKGHLDCLQYALEHGAPCDTSATGAACEQGHIQCLEYLVEHECPWFEDAYFVAARGGNLDCIQYLLHHPHMFFGPDQEDDICSGAASGGHIDILLYAHENRLPWSSRTTALAAKQGSLKCLAYLHEHGCPWDFQTCHNATQYGHRECLRYAQEHGCPS